MHVPLPVPHSVPTAQYAHAPDPSHEPFLPHVVFDSCGHSLSGSVLAPIAPHTPSVPPPFFAALHATHVPAHAVSQQKPSTQLPVAHDVAAVHDAPVASFAWHVFVVPSQ